jgi:hypothetical protein
LIKGCPGKRERFAFPPLGLAKTCGTRRGTPVKRSTRRKLMLEKMKKKLELELKTTDVAILYIEDVYRLQTVIDDHMRRMEELANLAAVMVDEIQGE